MANDVEMNLSDLQNLEYILPDESRHKYPIYGQGPHKVVVDKDGNVIDTLAYTKDIDVGFTNPNLHRRVDPQEPPEPTDPNYDPTDPKSVDRSYLNKEIEPRQYELEIMGVHSYRTTTKIVHSEESIDTEIP